MMFSLLHYSEKKNHFFVIFYKVHHHNIFNVKYTAGVKKEDTSSTILFSKEKLEKMHANAGQWTDGIKNIENEYDDHAENLGNVFWLLF